ncbi:MAG TPA: DUF4390 domain-containing protein [Candidatus Saccharimonadia bacterium]|nr:DUF4390 domain-containing protein [Candidatus Saccharimonadia bacterium]
MTNAALLSLIVLATLLPGCGDGTAPRASITRAALIADPAPALEAELELVLSRAMLDALEQGIPLVLELALEGRDPDATLSASRTLKLRYLPLARRWQLVDGGGAERHFARRAQLLAALDRVRVPLPPEWLVLRDGGRFRLTLSLDTGALPGPLRLPALLRRDWRFPTTTYAWQAAS